MNSRATALAGSAASSTPARDLAPVHSRASGTFTPIYDEDLALELKPTSAMLLWTVLNRFWSMRTPLYTPGQERLIKHTGLSKKTIERALKALQEDRKCRFRCGREHPLVFVRWNGMGHNATISPFTCDLTKPMKPEKSEQPAKTSRRGTSPTQERQNDAPLFDTEASLCPTQLRQNDAPLPEVGRQNGSALLGTQKPLFETSATETAAVVEALQENARVDVVGKLVAIGIVGEKATQLVSRFGAPACLKQLAAIDERRRQRRHIDNAPGLLIAALERGWASPMAPASRTTPPAPGIVDALRVRLESGRIPDAGWLRDSGISSELCASIEQEVRDRIESAPPAHPLCDALEAANPAAYAAAMQRLYENLNPPFGVTEGGYRHALFSSRCRSLLERELSNE